MAIAAQELNDTIPVTGATTRASDAPLPKRVLRNILSLDDFEAPARAYIPRPIFGYIKSGAKREDSLHGEIHRDMALLGVNTLAAVTRERVARADAWDDPLTAAP